MVQFPFAQVVEQGGREAKGSMTKQCVFKYEDATIFRFLCWGMPPCTRKLLMG
jgi:hypothetical protein